MPTAVINCSWGAIETSPGALTILRNFFEVISQYLPVVVSAGNANLDLTKITRVPAICANTITVGSCDRQGKKSQFSNFGPCVDILAPGEKLESGPQNTLIDGTSFSAPLVSGIIACMISDIKRRKQPGLTAANIKTKLLANADQKDGNRILTARFTQ